MEARPIVDEIEEHDEAIAVKALELLRTHFDSVQIFVSRQDGDRTVAGDFGWGNFFTRMGQVTHWLDNPTGLCEDDED